ncbi:MAG: ABC transporter permease subunit, partial [Sphaerochaetaceae bacterium]|nr:ABC transporter permease subunit [Sphaerochaetaceae bacterium]
MKELLLQLLKGTLTSLEIFFLTLLFALPLGLIVAQGRMSKHKIISSLVNVYIMIMRGTPLILQLLFVYFAPYYIFKASFDRFTAVIIAFVINYAAYFAEIYRGGIQSIPAGQYEASSVLGFSKFHTFTHIVMPQVIKRI